MKKSNLTLFIFLVIGLITGVIVGQLLASVPALSFLTKSVEIKWEPKADLQVLKYDILILIKLNLCSILGLVGAFLIYRKM
ncbi:hypothetical protein D3C73_512100 [compost metagenome]